MNDIEAMKRREVVFDQLRVAKSELAATSEKAMEIRRELSSKQDTVEVLTKLVNTMLSHDCCPLEAKLKYP
ncbi:MAG: hypothetical protein K2X74_22960, partial [Acetobacteraceae bacterium]|nr:hypothetical protein [Acetobacteraceae bacterium]